MLDFMSLRAGGIGVFCMVIFPVVGWLERDPGKNNRVAEDAIEVA
jgi:hypothetical protein